MFARLAAVLSFLALAPVPGMAQQAQGDPFAPAVVVNDSLVTNFDVAQRLRMMQLMGAAQGNDPQPAIESLIDDKLRAQAARRTGIELSEDQIAAALDDFARQRGFESGEEFVRRIGEAGVSRQAVVDLVANQAAFREAMRVRYLPRAQPTDAEIAAATAEGSTQGVGPTSLHIAELVIPVRERGPERTRELVNRLYEELSNGGDFAAAAREYSRTRSAPQGGDVGWMPLDRMPPQIGDELALLTTGQVTRPIEVPDAVVMLKVLDVRQDAIATGDAASAVPAAQVTVARLVIPLRNGATEADETAARAEAQQVVRDISSCSDIDARKASYGPGSGLEGPVALSSLPQGEREALANVQAGDMARVARVPAGMSIVMVCARTEDAASASDATSDELQQARSRLVNQRMESYAAGYLQELRRDAVIEYR
ncbi:peptidylprolyl isomerase [Oceanicella sp. SM1341]|uniref:peptidylprolyl isomerase n=1 Tax=Oceanicella sp. SM1341 TaxID=1548889 RepID=UPI0018E4F5BD|nr:peptidylprolyl isomerase [Oceanicella sp. SM1341]